MTTWFITGASRGFGLEIAGQALGSSVVAGIETKLAEIAEDVKRWRELTESTDFPDAVDGRLP